VIGAQGSPCLAPEQWQFNFGWRYQDSDRHFTGTTHEKVRDREDSQVKNTIHQLNLGFTCGRNEQTQVTVHRPCDMNERSSSNSVLPGERRYTTRIRVSTVDQSIQPEDGGFGLILDVEWFRQIGAFTPCASAAGPDAHATASG
jgi:hypothetical protein